MKTTNRLSFIALGLTLAASQVAQACSSESYTGSICTVSFNFCPEGTLEANGQELLVSQYQALYSLIGPTYGSTQANVKFNLPDLRGRSVVGVGQGVGLQQNVTWGQKRGNETVALSVAQLPAHTHAATFNQTGSNPITVNIPVSANTANNKPAPDTTFSYLAASPSGPSGAAMWSDTMTPSPVNIKGVTTSGGSSGSVTIGATGNGQPVATLPPQLGMKQCIVVNGIYPPRP